MTISWNDEDDPSELKLRNIQTCKNAFKFFPRLTKALKPRLSNYRFLNFRGPNNTKMEKEKKNNCIYHLYNKFDRGYVVQWI